MTFTLTPADGYTLTGTDYAGASLTRTGAAYILTLPDVRYSTAVAVTAEKSDTVLYYNDNCGGGWVTVPVTPSHLRLNTAIDGALFTRPGYTLTGWNTARGFTRSGLLKTTPQNSPTRSKTTPQP